MNNASFGNASHHLPLWLKVGYSLFMLVLVPVYWSQHGPVNFLWGCDIALFMALVAIWREWSLPASMAILVILVPDVIWNIDLALRLTTNQDVLGLNATAYMLNTSIPLAVRLLSLFHIFMAPMLLWVIYHIGYDKRALLWQILLTVIILPLSYMLTDPVRNVNWVYGFNELSVPWPAGPIHVLVLMVTVPLIFHLPVHLLMRYFFSRKI